MKEFISAERNVFELIAFLQPPFIHYVIKKAVQVANIEIRQFFHQEMEPEQQLLLPTVFFPEIVSVCQIEMSQGKYPINQRCRYKWNTLIHSLLILILKTQLRKIWNQFFPCIFLLVSSTL